MFDICLLGTGGMMPLPNRYLTSCLIRFGGHSILIDAGEGTQITLRRTGWSFKDIDVILFTHYHADHVAGLPGLLLTIGNSGRTEPITLIGPQGLKPVVEGLLRITGKLPFQVLGKELSKEAIDSQEEMPIGEMYVRAGKCSHGGMPCVGYSVEIKRRPKFDPVRAKEANIPLPYWRRLQNGETVTGEDGIVYTPEMVLGEDRKGLKITYSTDSRPTRTIRQLAADSDLFICEGMYGDPDKQEKTEEKHHMSFKEAATMAKEANVAELWLTHFSPAMPNPKEYEEIATSIFPNTVIGKDRMFKEFKYED